MPNKRDDDFDLWDEMDHPSGNIEDELAKVLTFNTAASPSITCTGSPDNCTRVASGSLCCC